MLGNIRRVNWQKLVLFLAFLVFLAGAVFVFYWQKEQREISFIESLKIRHPEGEKFVEEILKARKELKDFNSQNDFSAFLRLGVNFNLLGEKQKALDFYNQALKTDAKNILALNNMAEIYSDSGDFKKAEEYFLKLVEYYPDKPDFYRKLGYLYWYRLGKTPLEIENFFKAGLEKTNHHPDLINWLTNYFQEMSRPAGASSINENQK